MVRWLSIITGALAILAGIAYITRPPDYVSPNTVILAVYQGWITPAGIGVGFLLAGLAILAGRMSRSEITIIIGHTLGAIVYTMYGVALVVGAFIAGGAWGAGTAYALIGILHVVLAWRAGR